MAPIDGMLRDCMSRSCPAESPSSLPRHRRLRGWCEAGRFPGAYKLHDREWRIPLAAIEAFRVSRACSIG